jgi:hypothetical protein
MIALIVICFYANFSYKHFSQLWNLLRGELALTMEESLLSSGGVDKENKTVSSACHAKLSQFPVLPPKVSNSSQ